MGVSLAFKRLSSVSHRGLVDAEFVLSNHCDYSLLIFHQNLMKYHVDAVHMKADQERSWKSRIRTNVVAEERTD